jgi:hypothetical protein
MRIHKFPGSSHFASVVGAMIIDQLPQSLPGSLEALLDERDDLHLAITLGADDASPDLENLYEMSIRLAQLECAILEQRMQRSANAEVRRR